MFSSLTGTRQAKGVPSLGADLPPDMHNEFTAVIERDGDWYIAYCPEVPGANGQGRTKDEAKQNLTEAVALVLEDRRADGASVGPVP
jgi:predicted RNase H-like HicB family nuclease